MIETKIAHYFSTVAGIVALVGERIYLNEAPQANTRPYLVLEVDDSDHHHHMTGQSGLAEIDLKITIAADTYLAARTLLEVIRIPISGKINNVEMGEAPTVNVRRFVLTDFKAAVLPSVAGSDIGKRGIISMWHIIYREPTS